MSVDFDELEMIDPVAERGERKDDVLLILDDARGDLIPPSDTVDVGIYSP